MIHVGVLYVCCCAVIAALAHIPSLHVTSMVCYAVAWTFYGEMKTAEFHFMCTVVLGMFWIRNKMNPT